MGWPASLWFGEEKVRLFLFPEIFPIVSHFIYLFLKFLHLSTCQVRVFYAVRIFLAVLSVISDAALVVALSRKYGKRLASYTLAMLCLASGCFFASTSMFSR